VLHKSCLHHYRRRLGHDLQVRRASSGCDTGYASLSGLPQVKLSATNALLSHYSVSRFLPRTHREFIQHTMGNDGGR
jgi:hypothetical protein